MTELRFNVYGALVAIRGRAGAWEAYYAGPDGKRRPADFIVPGDRAEHEIEGYQADLFHENWTPRNHAGTRLAP